MEYNFFPFHILFHPTKFHRFPHKIKMQKQDTGKHCIYCLILTFEVLREESRVSWNKQFELFIYVAGSQVDVPRAYTCAKTKPAQSDFSQHKQKVNYSWTTFTVYWRYWHCTLSLTNIILWSTGQETMTETASSFLLWIYN